MQSWNLPRFPNRPGSATSPRQSKFDTSRHSGTTSPTGRVRSQFRRHTLHSQKSGSRSIAGIQVAHGRPRCLRSPYEEGAVTEYRLVAEPRVDLDVGAAFAWYEKRAD